MSEFVDMSGYKSVKINKCQDTLYKCPDFHVFRYTHVRIYKSQNKNIVKIYKHQNIQILVYRIMKILKCWDTQARFFLQNACNFV